eukprot:TRINITY_DN1333_c0_g1_i3.p1 TRINITY_DN1333_c0_g1~~TRINITY_DN1333_c0_g1_i3.p1  ORF type:complete len:295 (-),score=58.85 TRINITY_DN1333_c0_g1_i3:86-970(-)
MLAGILLLCALLQDGGHAAATLCQAIPPESSNPNTTGLLRSRIARVVLELHTKQDSVRLTPVQLGVVLRFLKDTLLLLSDGSMLVHDVISALAIVLRLHGSTHDLTLEVDGFLPVLLRQADAPAELTYRSAALEALTATCVKSWPTLADKWRGAACNCLSSSLAAHWRLEDMQSIEAQLCATAASGLVQVVSCKGGEQSLSPFLPRIMLALNHLVQPMSLARRRIASHPQHAFQESAAMRDITAAQTQSLNLLAALAKHMARDVYAHWGMFLPSHATPLSRVISGDEEPGTRLC